MDNLDATAFYDKLTELTLTYGPKLIGALVVLIIGLFIIKLLNRGFIRMLSRRKIEPSLKTFLGSLVDILLKTLLAISVLSTMGIQMTSFIAVLGAMGLAVGLALQGSLQNFAGGVLILLFKPFKVGDYIEAQDHAGTVKEIQIFNTILTTIDNRTVIIPNGGLSTETMVNFSTEPIRRVDRTYGIGYGDSIEQAREVLMKIINENKLILNEPAPPSVKVIELGDSSVDLIVRVWVKKEDYWTVYFDMNEKVYNEFNTAGLNIPYPQMDVHLHSEK